MYLKVSYVFLQVTPKWGPCCSLAYAQGFIQGVLALNMHCWRPCWRGLAGPAAELAPAVGDALIM